MSDRCADPAGVGNGRPAGAFRPVTDGIVGADVLRSAGFACLRQGRAATAEQLAASTGLGIDQVVRSLATMAEQGAAELDEQGRVVGVGGLSLVPTRHQLTIDGVELYTWCAYDALGIPPAARANARARSQCAHCGQVVEVVFDAGEAVGAPAVVTWFPGNPCTNARRDFCDAANLFCDRDHLDAWHDQAGNPPGQGLTITEVAALGRANWARDIRWPATP